MSSSPKRQASLVLRRLRRAYPGATCALHWRNPFELLVATVLSAQSTDERVNMITPDLFARFPNAAALAAADGREIEGMIASLGLFRNKAKNLRAMAEALCEHHGGEVPSTMGELTRLPGVARKTANVVLGTAFGQATGVVVDTHVSRLSVRLGWTPPQTTKSVNTDRMEKDLMALLPKNRWVEAGHALILHGRQVCHARKPECARCVLEDLCPKTGV